MPSPLDALLAFSKKQLEANDVMRVLVQHDDWQMPVVYLQEDKADSVVMYAEKFSLREDTLLVFTDRASMDVGAQKLGREALGIYAGKVKGTELFGGLERPALSKIKELHVNPGSPEEKRWFVGRGAFAQCGAWADAIKLERTLENPSAEMFGELGRYDGYWVPLAKSDQSFVQVPMDDGRVFVFAFTAPDTYQQFTKSLGERAAQVGSGVVPGKKLFPFLLGTKVDGVLINGRLPLDRAAMELIVTAP
jgi:hypothetical protein